MSKPNPVDVLRLIAVWTQAHHNRDECGNQDQPSAKSTVQSIRTLLDETLPKIIPKPAEANCNICLRHNGKYVQLVNAKCPECGAMDSLTQIQEQMRKNEEEAKRRGLVLIRVSKWRFIIAKIGSAEGGHWNATQIFGPATKEQCITEIGKLP